MDIQIKSELTLKKGSKYAMSHGLSADFEPRDIVDGTNSIIASICNLVGAATLLVGAIAALAKTCPALWLMIVL